MPPRRAPSAPRAPGAVRLYRAALAGLAAQARGRPRLFVGCAAHGGSARPDGGGRCVRRSGRADRVSLRAGRACPRAARPPAPGLALPRRDGGLAHLRPPGRSRREPDPRRARSCRWSLSDRRLAAGRSDRRPGGVHGRGEYPPALSRVLHARREPPAPRLARARARRRQGPPVRGNPAGFPMKRAWAVLLVGAAALPARAHQQSVSVGEVDVRGNRISARLRFAGADLNPPLQLDQGPDGAYTQDGVEAVLPALLHLTLDEYAVSTPDGPCRRNADGRAEVEGDDGIVVEGSWTCPGEVESLRVRVGFLEVLPPGHAHLAKVSFAGRQVSQRVAQADSPGFDVERRTGFWS